MTSIPAFHVSSRSRAEGKGIIFIQSRKDALSSGTFAVGISVHFNPATDDYPSGSIRIKTDLSDSLKASFSSTSIELINSYGKHNPTIDLTGRCRSSAEKSPKGLRYWVMIADNRRGQEGTPDIVGFVIHDRQGNRVAYGTGPVRSGDIKVEPS
ncbi:MAG: hypothetical protein ABI675_20335 [Chitinophagaceae bacterium]